MNAINRRQVGWSISAICLAILAGCGKEPVQKPIRLEDSVKTIRLVQEPIRLEDSVKTRNPVQWPIWPEDSVKIKRQPRRQLRRPFSQESTYEGYKVALLLRGKKNYMRAGELLIDGIDHMKQYGLEDHELTATMRAELALTYVSHLEYRLSKGVKTDRDNSQLSVANGYVEKAEKTLEDNKFVLYARARIQEQLGNKDEAIQLYRQAKDVVPGFFSYDKDGIGLTRGREIDQDSTKRIKKLQKKQQEASLNLIR